MIEHILTQKIKESIQAIYSLDVLPEQIQLQKTRKEFSGDFTLVIFPFVKLLKSSPEAIGNTLGEYLKQNAAEVSGFNVIKGFLNLEISLDYWFSFFTAHAQNETFGFTRSDEAKPVVVEYSSPNTNKPLHLGHIRNNLLGFSLSRILSANGKKVIRVNLVNDRGIHICKSMLAWQKFGNGETPQSSGLKGDHLVGKYYVLFDKEYKMQIADLESQGMKREEAERQAPLMQEAQEMLRQWELGDQATVDLWRTMNGWVYEGFAATYQTLGIEFEKTYYESNTYLLGKQLVEQGLQNHVFYQRDDKSVWINLTEEGLDEKLLLRSDGTSVYMTQDLGTAMQRYQEFHPEQLVYVVGNEQEYHFQVLKLVIKHLGESWWNSIYHLSYGMVELPHGKMKSREGTVVDADDLMEEMFATAKDRTRELGKIQDFENEEAEKLYRTIGLGALKYFILKVDPKKNMLFNPEESVDFNGNTGPFIQYTYARIRSVLRKAGEQPNTAANGTTGLLPQEKTVLKFLHDFPQVVQDAAHEHNPAVVANYAYELACEFNRFYHDVVILKEENPGKRNFRLQLSRFTGQTLKNALWLMGMDVPERM